MVVVTAGLIVCFGLVSKIYFNQNLVARAAALLTILRCGCHDVLCFHKELRCRPLDYP